MKNLFEKYSRNGISDSDIIATVTDAMKKVTPKVVIIDTPCSGVVKIEGHDIAIVLQYIAYYTVSLTVENGYDIISLIGDQDGDTLIVEFVVRRHRS